MKAAASAGSKFTYRIIGAHRAGSENATKLHARRLCSSGANVARIEIRLKMGDISWYASQEIWNRWWTISSPWRGPASHDQRHRFVLSGVYQFPLGIEVSTIVTAASGRPFTPLAGADLNGDGDGGAFPSDRARRNPVDPRSSVGRHSGTMPGQVSVDARLSKRFTLRGTSLVALVEAFNLFDRANFTEVNNLFGRGAFPGEPQRDAEGRVTFGLFEQAAPPRQVQLALRLGF